MTRTITNIFPLDNDPNYRVIYIDGVSEITLPLSTIERLNLAIDQIWTDVLSSQIKSIEEIEDARTIAIDLISRKAWGVKELATRLIKRGVEPTVATLATEQLEADGWLNDFTYACARIRDWTRHEPASRYWLLRKLEERELAKEVSNLAIEEELGSRSEQDAATQLAILRLAKVTSGDEATIRRKVISALSRRGFTTDVGAEALRRAQAKNA
jgi:SOS response regulatory protein OraA/RecX